MSKTLMLVLQMGFVLWAYLLAYLHPYIRVAYENLDYYLLTPKRIKNIMSRQGVRGPKPRLLIGNLREIGTLISKSTFLDMPTIDHDIVPRLLPHFDLWSRLYGKRFTIWAGSEPWMCLTETKLIKELLAKHYSITGKSWLLTQASKNFIGRGLLMANGNDWNRQRDIIGPSFSRDKLMSYSGYMVECTALMIESMEIPVVMGLEEFDIREYMGWLSADIISRTVFDSHYEKGKEILDLLRRLLPLCGTTSQDLLFPGRRFLPNIYNRQIKSLNVEVERLLMEIIENRRDTVNIYGRDSYGDDILGMLLNEMQKKKEEGDALSINLQVIMDECKTFLIAGHETTTMMLTWTIMLLASNPSWQDKVRAEVRDVCNGGSPSFQDLSKLHMLNLVINESLRLYPPAPILPRMAFEDIKLGELHIPKGLSIWIPVLAMHHNQEIWGEDVHEFNPDRFNNMSWSQQSYYMPFASGRRNCVAQSFARMEAKIILSMFISKFRFTISNNYKHAPVTMITIQPKHGVLVHIERLEQ